jgi:hypothetical protein
MQTDPFRTVSYAADIVVIDGKSFRMDYAVRDAFWTYGRAIVLLDPDAYLADPAYGKDRRRGAGPIRNLRAFSADGAQLWQAELPEPVDYYYQVENRKPLVALSFSSFRCEIDPHTGCITSKEFLK